MGENETPLILVIDDEVNIRKTLLRSLKGSGYEVETAVNGEEGLEKMEQRAPDVVLLDMKMPGLSGIEVLREMREREIYSKVVIITAYGTVDNAVEAMKLGAVDFLQKPFLPDDIRQLIRDLLERPSLEDLSPDESDYDELVDAARIALTSGDHERAETWLRRALAADDKRPEAHNLLGVYYELVADKQQALKMYRAALSLDPSYGPANRNLERATELRSDSKPMDLGYRSGEKSAPDES
ncbi:MAG: response regulator [Bacillota bacterium]